jgi:cytidine deaminase
MSAMCEAQKLNEKITHSLCIVRDDEKSSFKVLTPCGICQERLIYWGDDVIVGLTNNNNELVFKPLKEINLFHWSNAYCKDTLEKYEEIQIVENN